MSAWHSILNDPMARRSASMQVDDNDTLTVYEEQDIEPVLEMNQRLRANVDERHGWKGDMHRVASIPLVVYDQLLRDGKTRDTAYMKKWLNDPVNAVFRTRPGQV